MTVTPFMCKRVDTGPPAVPSTTSHCAMCEAEVWISESGVKTVQDLGYQITCSTCVMEHVTPNTTFEVHPRQILELLELARKLGE